MTRLRPEPRYLPLALAFVAIAAHAQQGDGGAAPAGTIRPRVGLSQSWTDNLRLSEHDKDAALITSASAGVNIVRNAGAVRGTLDYALNGITYLKTGYGSQIQNALSANGVAEVVPGTFFVEGQASIGQQNASAFGVQSAPTLGSQGTVSALDNPNRRETGTLNVSPLLRGQLGGVASAELRANYAITEVRGSALGDSRGNGASLRINQLTPGIMSWYLLANTQQTNPKVAASNRASAAMAGVNYRPGPDWVLNANAGRERTNYLGGGVEQSGFTGGVAADWSPSPRTHVGANWQRHTYGNSHGFSLDHRMRNSVWRYADSRSVTLGNVGSLAGVRTNYDLYFMMLASLEPDPVKRDARVREVLASLGLSPDSPASLGFLSTGPTRARSQMLSFALQGVRSNVTAVMTRSVSERLSGGGNANQGDLAGSNVVEQRSYSLTGGYQLTPVSGLSLTASRQESFGDAASQRTQLTSLMLSLTSRLGARLSAQLGARHSRFEGTVPYSENAAYANLTQSF